MTDQVKTPVLDLSKYIDKHFFGERAHIRGRRLPVAVIAYHAISEKWGVAELAYNFGASEAEVLSALLYYEEHGEEIDAQEEQERALFDEMYDRQHDKG